jgi:hypothetical protein
MFLIFLSWSLYMKLSFSAKSLIATAVAAYALAASGIAQADVLTANIQPGFQTATLFDNATPVAGSHELTPFLVQNSGNANSLFNGSFFAFCIEPLVSLSNEAVGSGDSSYAASFTATPLVQRLFDIGFDDAQTSSAKAVAFNLALQELLIEAPGSYSLDSGSYVRSGLGSDAFSLQAVADGNTLLGQILAAPDAAVHKQIVLFDSAISQDLMTALNEPVTPPNGVPEPSSVLLMLGALAAMGVARRRA